MNEDRDADDAAAARVSVADVAMAAANWLRHQREQRGQHYVAVPELEAPSIVEAVARSTRAGASGSSPSTVRPRQPAAATAGSTATSPVAPSPSVPSTVKPSAAAAGKLPVLDTALAKLEYLRTRNVGDCQRCGLAQTRNRLVFGAGNPDATIMFVGEAPGAEEDARGEPFVGAAGRRLDEWLAALGLARDRVYIANVLKCRPPRNRDPEPEEIAKCSPFLHAQIRAIQPRVLVALGRFAGQQLLGGEATLAAMRGPGREYVEPKSATRIPVVVTYHPSYVLRREADDGSQGSTARKSENSVVLDDLRVALGYASRP